MDDVEYLKTNDVPSNVIDCLIADKVKLEELLTYERTDFTEWAHEHKIRVAAKIKLVTAIKRKRDENSRSSQTNTSHTRSKANINANNNGDAPQIRPQTQLRLQELFQQEKNIKQTLDNLKSMSISTQKAIDSINNRFRFEDDGLQILVNEIIKPLSNDI